MLKSVKSLWMHHGNPMNSPWNGHEGESTDSAAGQRAMVLAPRAKPRECSTHEGLHVHVYIYICAYVYVYVSVYVYVYVYKYRYRIYIYIVYTYRVDLYTHTCLYTSFTSHRIVSHHVDTWIMVTNGFWCRSKWTRRGHERMHVSRWFMTSLDLRYNWDIPSCIFLST
jgi:hypothetical protein